MDVTKQSFPFLLPKLLNAVAGSHFVSFDLEFSGIASKGYGPADSTVGQQTLQQRYEETKEAAERYQVLQIGLTCAWEDPKNGGYILRPYNFHLNPVIEERLDIERIWSYQGSAVEFLLRNDFRMDAPYLEGVHYLSRDEEALAMQRAIDRQDKSRIITDINVKNGDLESLQFMEEIREQINAWLAKGSKRDAFMNIPPPSEGRPDSSDTSLNNFKKRLVHQLVRAEYPNLVTIGRGSFIQIMEFDQEREDSAKATQLKRTKERISRQLGFRWIVEAMCGGSLSGLRPRILVGRLDYEKHIEEILTGTGSFQNLRDRLKLKRTILVGHNLFTDLINFYSCFLGVLPDRVEDFQRAIHDLFPVVIDTKYLATHNCGSINPRSSLSEIESELGKLETPKIVLHSAHPKYQDGGQLHEAGYDSFLTAKVLIKLSTQIELSGEYLKEDDLGQISDDDYFTPPEDEEDLVGDTKKSSPGEGSPKRTIHTRTEHPERPHVLSLDGLSEDVSLISFDDPPEDIITRSKQVMEGCGQRTKPAMAHANKFGALANLSEDSPTRKHKLDRQRRSEPSQKSLLDDHPIPTSRTHDGYMPSFGDSFWRVYGNKLRVFGTVEGICDLNSR